MPPLPFNSGQSSGLDELAGASPLVINQLVDTTGTLKPRPGLVAWDGFPEVPPAASAVVAMVPWGNILVYVTADRRIWAIYPGGFAVALSTASEDTMMHGPRRPIGITTRSRVILVAGGAAQKWEGGALTERLLGIDGWYPPYATHIASVGPRLVVNTADQSGRIQWSNLGENPGHETWDALDYAEAEAKSDPLVAVADNANEAFAFGTRSIQVFTPDPYVGLAAGRSVNVGLLAPYSLVSFDDEFAFLDRERRFVKTDGRGFTDNENVISKPIEAVLRPLAGTNAWGFRMAIDRFDAGVWFFPTSGLGFIWNRRNGQWSEWRAWGDTGYVPHTITSAVQWPEMNLLLVGLDTGQIVKLDVNARTDMGQLIKLHNRTGFVAHGTAARKHSRSVRFVFKRGTAPYGATPPPVHISWRDDLGAFRDPVVRDLGVAGEYNPVIELRSTGVYRQRQWEVTYTSDADYTLVAAEEDFEVLGN
jgi:hypothetical protein